jgi:2-C-methyl-D-erythritol 4-phosphate cytidylyltransferase
MKKIVIIPSGGTGKRLGSSLPKQYLKFNNKELLVYTLEKFQESKLVDSIIIAAQEEYFELIISLKTKYNLSKISQIVEGGNKRQDSVYNALIKSNADPDDIIAVHDAARPLIPTGLIDESLKQAEIYDSIVVAMKAKDTLLKGKEKVESYIEREEIYYVQTPQIFRAKILLDAMKKAYNKGFYGTDESMLVKMAGYDVKIVEGSSFNFKITTQSDIEVFNALCCR